MRFWQFFILTLVIKFMIKSILQFKGKSLLCSSKVGRSCYNTTARGQAGCPEVMKLGNWQNGLFDSDLSVSYIACHNMTPPLYLYLYIHTWYLSFFYTDTFWGLKILHSKVRKFATKIAPQINSINLRHKLPHCKIV